MISMRMLNAIAIIDGRTKEIVWLWGPNNVAVQHHPRLLANGNILLFDNGIEQSRVIELDPIEREVVWVYEEGSDFFSNWGGSVQRLANGNTLITDTAGGYAFEVASDGDVVWKFANPAFNEEEKRFNMWRMTRFSEEDLPFLGKNECR